MIQKCSIIGSIHVNKCIETKQGDSIGKPLAEIVVWKWKEDGQQDIIAVCEGARSLKTLPLSTKFGSL